MSISKNTSILSASVIKKMKLNYPFFAIHPGSGSKKKRAPINTIINIAKEIVIKFLNTDFEEGRHRLRVDKI